MKHTPTPWEAGRAYKQKDNPDFFSAIFSAAKYQEHHVPRPAECYGVSKEEAAANARFICTAVNHHAALVAALEACERQIDVLMTWRQREMPALTLVCARDNQNAARALLARIAQEPQESPEDDIEEARRRC